MSTQTKEAVEQLLSSPPELVDNRVIDTMAGECRIKISADGNADVQGHDHRGARVISYQKSRSGEATLAVKFDGYSFNPGSKYSGLTLRIPPETVIYRVNTLSIYDKYEDIGRAPNIARGIYLLATAIITIDHSRSTDSKAARTARVFRK